LTLGGGGGNRAPIHIIAFHEIAAIGIHSATVTTTTSTPQRKRRRPATTNPTIRRTPLNEITRPQYAEDW